MYDRAPFNRFKLFRIKDFFRQGIYFDASRRRIRILRESDIIPTPQMMINRKKHLTKLPEMGLNSVTQNVKSRISI